MITLTYRNEVDGREQEKHYNSLDAMMEYLEKVTLEDSNGSMWRAVQKSAVGRFSNATLTPLLTLPVSPRVTLDWEGKVTAIEIKEWTNKVAILGPDGKPRFTIMKVEEDSKVLYRSYEYTFWEWNEDGSGLWKSYGKVSDRFKSYCTFTALMYVLEMRAGVRPFIRSTLTPLYGEACLHVSYLPDDDYLKFVAWDSSDIQRIASGLGSSAEEALDDARPCFRNADGSEMTDEEWSDYCSKHMKVTRISTMASDHIFDTGDVELDDREKFSIVDTPDNGPVYILRNELDEEKMRKGFFTSCIWIA